MDIDNYNEEYEMDLNVQLQSLFDALTDDNRWYETDALIARVIELKKEATLPSDIVLALNGIYLQLCKVEKAESEIEKIIESLNGNAA